jgi:hypothetical protein
VHAVEVADCQRRASFREGEGGEGAEAAVDLHGGIIGRRAARPERRRICATASNAGIETTFLKYLLSWEICNYIFLN